MGNVKVVKVTRRKTSCDRDGKLSPSDTIPFNLPPPLHCHILIGLTPSHQPFFSLPPSCFCMSQCDLERIITVKLHRRRRLSPVETNTAMERKKQTGQIACYREKNTQTKPAEATARGPVRM